MQRFSTGHLIILASLALAPAVFAQGNPEEGRLRGLNAEALRLRGLLHSANANEQAQIHAQGAAVLEQRQALLESLMSALPGPLCSSPFRPMCFRTWLAPFRKRR